MKPQNDNEEYGYVYVLKNDYMPGIVKIGKTIAPLDRLATLYNTSVPQAFKAIHISKMKKRDMDRTERTLHEVFDHKRINPRREFFEEDVVEHAIKIMELVEVEDVTNEINNETKAALLPEERPSFEDNSETLRRVRRPNLNFHYLDIKDNERLFWKDDENIFVTVCGERKVNYNGEECSLTAATQQILNDFRPIQPSPLWLHNGRPLIDIYNERYAPVDSED